MPLAKARILTVDDEDDILDGYNAALSGDAVDEDGRARISDLGSELFGKENKPLAPEESFRTHPCRQGEEAVEAVRQALEERDPYSVAFIDVRMPPGMDGVAAAEKIREMDPNINIVIVTGYSDVLPRAIAERVRPEDKLLYCHKPVHAAELQQLARALSSKWQMETKLHAAQERMSHLLQVSPAIIYSTKASGDFAATFISQNVEQQLGWSPSAFLDDPEFWANHIHPHDQPQIIAALRTLFERGCLTLEYRFQHIDGTYRWILDDLKVVKGPDSSQDELVGQWIDITARKEAELHVEAARTEAEGVNKAKSHFLAVMSHELRTPLNAIMGFSKLISNEANGPVGDAHYLEYASDIRASGEKLLEVLRDILEFSQVDTGDFEIREDWLDLSRITRSSLETVEASYAEKQVQLEFDVPENLPTVRSDRKAVKRILRNLLSNALKYTNAGGTVRVAVIDGLFGGLSIAVSDTGIGMNPDEIENAIKPFTQVDEHLSRRTEGIGLGLPLCLALSKLLGVRLNIESQTGHGTTVTLVFPREKAEQEFGDQPLQAAHLTA